MNIKICIDASNIREGGGVTHLSELLHAASLDKHGFESILIFAPQSTLDAIESKPWLKKNISPEIKKGLLYRIYWQRFILARLIREAGCHILFVPGGSDVSGFSPVVTMSQNLLPFDRHQIFRYGLSIFTFKLILLRLTQSRSFRKSNGVIFLTNYARKVVMLIVEKTSGQVATIPHGIDPRFLLLPRAQLGIEHYTMQEPFKIIYVSTIDMYKNQWNVAEAVARLRNLGFPVVLNLIGSPRHPAINRLQSCLSRIDPDGDFINYMGVVAFSELHKYYAQADLMVFASCCENMPNILLEGMASGLPIACSDRGPMPEILGDAGTYFNPENVTEIANAIRVLLNSRELRKQQAHKAYERAQHFSWERCAHETFGFILNVAANHLVAVNTGN